MAILWLLFGSIMPPLSYTPFICDNISSHINMSLKFKWFDKYLSHSMIRVSISLHFLYNSFYTYLYNFSFYQQ